MGMVNAELKITYTIAKSLQAPPIPTSAELATCRDNARDEIAIIPEETRAAWMFLTLETDEEGMVDEPQVHLLIQDSLQDVGQGLDTADNTPLYIEYEYYNDKRKCHHVYAVTKDASPWGFDPGSSVFDPDMEDGILPLRAELAWEHVL